MDQTDAELSITVLPRALLVDDRLYYYAMQSDEDGEETAYCHGGEFPLYAHFGTLRIDVANDGLRLDEEDRGLVDVDRALHAVRLRMTVPDMDSVLIAWNCLEEVAEGLGVPMNFRGDLANRAYDKLFWGLNLPSVTPADRHYIPYWRRKEIAKIVRILRSGHRRITAAIADRGIEGSPLSDLWAI